MASLTVAALPIATLARGTAWVMFRGGRNPQGSNPDRVVGFRTGENHLGDVGATTANAEENCGVIGRLGTNTESGEIFRSNRSRFHNDDSSGAAGPHEHL
jgi:hypothetical protein